MSTLAAALADASRLRMSVLKGAGYAIAYGSLARRRSVDDGVSSDLDLLFVGPPLGADQLETLVGAVIRLHNDHGLRLDTEVAFDVKLHATEPEVAAATALQGFTPRGGKGIEVTPVIVDPVYLNSRPFKLRLILNALTTTHVFLGGDLAQFRADQARAERAIGLLALTLVDAGRPWGIEDAARALVTGPEGATGEDYLGYANDPALHSVLYRGVTSLAAEGLVHPIDGATFRRRQ